MVVDEAHERSINTDVILGLLKSAAHKNPSLKIIVTSATIDTALFRDFFGQAACLDIPGRMFPVAVKYRAIPEADDLVRPVVGAVMSILVDTGSAAMIADATASRPTPNSLIDEEDGTEPQRSSLTSTLGGDVLVFLTGQVWHHR